MIKVKNLLHKKFNANLMCLTISLICNIILIFSPIGLHEYNNNLTDNFIFLF